MKKIRLGSCLSKRIFSFWQSYILLQDNNDYPIFLFMLECKIICRKYKVGVLRLRKNDNFAQTQIIEIL